MKLLIIQLIVIGTFCDSISCSGYFTIVGSKLLRQNGKYTVAITSRNLKCIQGQDFNQFVRLNMNTKNVSVFVQTDKAIYKPNDTVQFRVLVLNEHLKPLDGSNFVQIHITDRAKNRVKQYDEVTFTKGVFESDIKLSDAPLLGDWHIHVIVNNRKEATKIFEVAEYTLPNFEFKIDINPHAYFDQRKLTAKLQAKYTFGKIARGNATFTAKVSARKVSNSMEINGEKLVEVDLENDLGIKDKNNERCVELLASFKEELTGRIQNATAKIQVHITPHKIEVERNSKNFKPGLPFTARAIVQYHEKGAPVTDRHNPVTFIQTYYYKRMTMCRRTVPPNPWSSQLPKSHSQRLYEYCECLEEVSYEEVSQAYATNGISDIVIQIPDNTTKFFVAARYLDTESDTRYIPKSQSKWNEYIKIKIKIQRPQMTENLTLNIQSTKAIDEFSYHVFSTKGDVVASHTIRTFPTKSTDFEFTPTYDMVPQAKIVVFYITSDGEIISDSLELEFNNHLRNFINIAIPKSNVTPSELVDISITSNPNSFVGLLGVDQSVLLLEAGNDIEWSTVIDDLKQYNEVNRLHQISIPCYEDFDTLEVFIITNAKREYDAREYGAFFPRGGFDDPMWRVVTIDEAPKTLRKTFPETWLFDSFNFEFNQTNAVISTKVPDTITSWIITGFSIDPVTGLGLSKQPTKLNVFQPFFLSMNLPYSIKRGEIVSIPISVFNYLGNDLTVAVTLYNEDSEFEFIEAKEGDNILRQNRVIENLQTKNTDVLSQQSNSISFVIRPLKVGLIKIKVVANSPVAGDRVERYLIVKPEGVTKYTNKAIFIDLTGSEKFETPLDVVSDSIRIEASETGDILGASIKNIDKLIKLPYGCGEENLLHLIENIVVLDYLTAVNKLTPEIEKKAITFLETGYQSVQTHKHDGGSYNTCGNRYNRGTTWLTASVARSFRQAAKYISIDTAVIRKSLEFLSRVQLDDGSFLEVSYISEKQVQGGSSNGIALTAHTLITFLENTDFVETYKSTIDKALAFLSANHQNVTDNYSLTIMAYALHLADHSLKYVILSKLETGAITESGMIYWRKDSSASNEPSSLDIEMTAYALQAFLEADRTTDSIKIMKWLVSQRNENGGFKSIQDTVVGLQALSKMATKMYASNTNIDITVKHINNEQSTLQVNERNALILQKYELPPAAKHFKITATGRGFSIFQLSYQYNIDTSSKEKGTFVVNPVINMTSTRKNFLHFTVCTNFIPDNITEKCDMAVMEVTFPSGFAFDTDLLSDLEATKEVKKVQTKDSKTVVVVYFDDLSVTSVCPEFIAFRTNSVTMQKPAPVVVYDYYDTNRQALGFYNLPEISVCDICDDDKECLQYCEESNSNDI